MGQFTGGSDFDEVWEEWSNASLKLLREAAARFAHTESDERALTPGAVVGALLSMLAKPRPANFYSGRPTWPLRFFDGIEPLVSASDAFEKFPAPPQRANCAEVVTELTKVISSAASEWAQGNPDQPDPREVLRELFRLLWSQRLIPRPPSNKYPQGI
jgi:hypothetical protein